MLNQSIVSDQLKVSDRLQKSESSQSIAELGEEGEVIKIMGNDFKIKSRAPVADSNEQEDDFVRLTQW